MLKAIIRYALNRTVNRGRFNDSPLYNLYLQICLPEVARKRKSERAFYRDVIGIPRADIVFDIGANIGNKTIIFLDFSKYVVSVEPNPDTVLRLRQRFFHNARVHIVPKACGAQIGIAPMHAFEGADAYNTISTKWTEELIRSEGDGPHLVIKRTMDVLVTTLDHLIKEYGAPHYIKIDAEGYELQVIRGLSIAVPLVSFECNLPVFKSETLEIIKLLTSRDPTALYNFVITEPPEHFETNRWLTKNEIETIVGEGRFEFMEIFCRGSLLTH